MLHTHDLDVKAYREIEKKARTTAELARILKVSRTTLVYRLGKMESEHKIMIRKNAKGALLWFPVYDQSHGKASVSIYVGHTFVRAYTALWKLKKGSIVYAIYGKKSVRAELRHISRTFMLESQRRIRNRKIITKAIINQDAIAVLSTFNDELLKAHTNRSRGTCTYTSTQFFHSTGEVIVARSFILLIDVSKRRSVLIRNKEIASLTWDIAQLLFDLLEFSMPTKQFDIERVIQAILQQRSCKKTVNPA